MPGSHRHPGDTLGTGGKAPSSTRAPSAATDGCTQGLQAPPLRDAGESLAPPHPGEQDV